jgi:hypothetical protein
MQAVFPPNSSKKIRVSEHKCFLGTRHFHGHPFFVYTANMPIGAHCSELVIVILCGSEVFSQICRMLKMLRFRSRIAFRGANVALHFLGTNTELRINLRLISNTENAQHTHERTVAFAERYLNKGVLLVEAHHGKGRG